MHIQRRTTPRWLILVPIGVLILIAGALALARGRPRLADTFPDPGAVAVPGLAPVRLTFSRPMNRESVAQNLRFQPAVPGDLFWEGNTLTFTPSQPWPAGETITVTLGSGARASAGLPLAETQAWSFRAAPTLLAYLWPADGDPNLFTLDPASGNTFQLTDTGGVLDYSLSPDGLTIYFSVQNGQGGADLWRLDRLSGQAQPWILCREQLCSAPQPSPDGTYLAYENTSRVEISLVPLHDNAPRLPNLKGVRPLWSSQGLLAYYNPDQAAYLIFDPASGETRTFPNETGEPGDWAPDGAAFVTIEIFPASEAQPFPVSHLLSFLPVNGIITNLSNLDDVEDSSPAFSPDGAWLAFARKFLSPDRWTPGRQLWLMRPTGGEAFPLTDAPLYNHSAFAWHPDGKQIAYVRSNQATFSEPPEIWLIDIEQRQPLRLVIGGFAPRWIP